VKRYLINLLIGIDQLANVVFAGRPDETISSRAHRLRHRPFWALARRGINWLFFWQEDHCQKAWMREMQRRHFPRTMRELKVE